MKPIFLLNRLKILEVKLWNYSRNFWDKEVIIRYILVLLLWKMFYVWDKVKFESVFYVRDKIKF